MRAEQRSGFAMAAPYTAFLLIFALYPILFALALVFMQWDLVTTPKFAGLANVQLLANDGRFWRAVANTFVFLSIHLPLQIATASHTTIAGIRGDTDFVVGARGLSAKTNVWDGLIDDVRLTRAALPAEALLLNSGQPVGEHTIGYWRFESNSGLYKDSSPRGHDIEAKVAQSKPADPRKAALIDFCHVLLNSNEFLYVD